MKINHHNYVLYSLQGYKSCQLLKLHNLYIYIKFNSYINREGELNLTHLSLPSPDEEMTISLN